MLIQLKMNISTRPRVINPINCFWQRTGSLFFKEPVLLEIFGLFLTERFERIVLACIHGNVLQKPGNAQNIIDLRRRAA